MTTEPEDLRDPLAALPIARRACGMGEQLCIHSLGHVLDTLALAQHMTGDTATAVQTQERAVSLVPKDDPQLKGVEAQLAKFQAALAVQSAPDPSPP